jgi:hypothetical protein
MASATRFERRLQSSGILLILGLLVEALCLLWARPLALVLLVGLGGLLLGLGALWFLFSIVSKG